MFTLKKTGSSGSQAKRWGSQQQESNKVEKKKKKKESNKVGWEGLRKRQMKVQRTNLLLS